MHMRIFEASFYKHCLVFKAVIWKVTILFPYFLQEEVCVEFDSLPHSETH